MDPGVQRHRGGPLKQSRLFPAVAQMRSRKKWSMSIQELENRMGGLERWQQYLNDKLIALERRMAALENLGHRRESHAADRSVEATIEGDWQPVSTWSRG